VSGVLGAGFMISVLGVLGAGFMISVLCAGFMIRRNLVERGIAVCLNPKP